MKAQVDGAYLHLLRDSYATQFTKDDGDTLILSRQLGHKTESMTKDRYIRYKTRDIREELRRIERGREFPP
ncbi:unnamed protein product [marine sediment metagenome]|uniref:Tyr recombinase domain-containing protein n=1 Tax=marine sediment metagenome TaxID=412755 RepID=X1W356_9ZZZZ